MEVRVGDANEAHLVVRTLGHPNADEVDHPIGVHPIEQGVTRPGLSQVDDHQLTVRVHDVSGMVVVVGEAIAYRDRIQEGTKPLVLVVGEVARDTVQVGIVGTRGIRHNVLAHLDGVHLLVGLGRLHRTLI